MKLTMYGKRLAVVLAVVLALVAVACGGVTSEPTSTADTSTADTSTADTSTADTSTADTSTAGTSTGEGDASATSRDSLDVDAAAHVAIDLFMEGALAEDVSVENCTLTDGTDTSCYRITVAGYPADHEVGPFCPDTIDTTAEDAGIWFDGEGIYDLDGDFIVGLADHYDDENWHLHDDEGHVHVTETAEAFDAAARPNVAPEYQNHCVEGHIAWLPEGEPVTTTVIIPVEPVASASATQSRGNLGVTLNGVMIAAPAPVEAILGAYTIAAFDDCGGHINPIDGYHLHGALGCGEVEVEGHANIFGYALDGYAIHSPYDENGDTYPDLDACGGHTSAELGYHYHASPAAENTVIGCLSGETAR